MTAGRRQVLPPSGKFISLHMILKTWTKESKGLFYLKAPQNELRISHYYLTESRIFFGNSSNMDILFGSEEHLNEVSRVFKKFKIHLDANSNENCWLTTLSDDLSSSKNLYTSIETEVLDSESRLEEGSIIRFGRQVIRVSKIYRNKGSHDNRKVTSIDNFVSLGQVPAQTNRTSQRLSPQSAPEVNTGEQPTCRICLEPETAENPFEKDMCMCSAHMPAHFECLVKWLQKKCEQITKGRVVYYDIERLKCDICKQSYQPIVKFNGRDHNLLDIKPLANQSAVILEVYNLTAKEVKGIYFIQIEDKVSSVISIGRTSKSDIRLNDASVSRNHAKFVWTQNEFHVMDLKSKFGTCRLVKAKFPLIHAEQKLFVIDKYMVSFHVMQTKKHCPCFKKGINFVTNPLNPPENMHNQPENLSQVEEQPEEEDEVHILERIIHLEPRAVGIQNRNDERQSLRPLGSNPDIPTEANGDMRPTRNVHLDQFNDRPTENLAYKPIDDSRKSMKNTRQNSPPHLISPVFHPPQTTLEQPNNPRRFNFSNAHFETHAMNQSNQTDYLMTNFDHSTQRREFVSGSDRFQNSTKNPSTSTEPPLISRIKPLNLPPENNVNKENANKNVMKLGWQQSNQRLSIFDPPPKSTINPSPVQALNLDLVRNNIREEESVEELVFSARTISNLAFDECDDYEFN